MQNGMKSLRSYGSKVKKFICLKHIYILQIISSEISFLPSMGLDWTLQSKEEIAYVMDICGLLLE